jgi:type IV secretion system protein VirD4
MILARLALPLIFAATVAAILWQWHRTIGFVASDIRWWRWLIEAAAHPNGLPAPILRSAAVTAAVGVLTMFGAAALFGRARNRTDGGFRSNELHGTARWARAKDVREAGLFSKSGVVVGGWPGVLRPRTLRHDGPEHILCFAPTRSGKGVSLILPTLLSWTHSILVLDIKGENYALTAGWRASLGHRVLKFDPAAAEGSTRFNPLAEMRVGTGRDIADCQNIANMIIDPDGKGLKDYWQRAGWAWLSTAILHVLYRVQRDEGRTACLADVFGFLSGIGTEEADVDDDGFVAMLDDMIAFDHGSEAINHEVRRGATDMRRKAPQERSGVHSNAVVGMAVFADPIIAANTSESDFAIGDLMNGEAPAALYLMVPPSDIDRLRPVLRVMMNLILRRLTETMAFEDGAAKKHYKHRLLLMLDEFTSIGKLDIMEKALAYMAGYGLKAFVIVQDIAQLHQAYGKDESITSNCHVRTAFAPNRLETARHLSDLAGKTTVMQDKRSRSGKLGDQHSVSDSRHEQGRALMTPDEVMRLRGLRKRRFLGGVRPGEALIFVAGSRPIRGVQRLYFQDKRLRRRAAMPPPATEAEAREAAEALSPVRNKEADRHDR